MIRLGAVRPEGSDGPTSPCQYLMGRARLLADKSSDSQSDNETVEKLIV